MEESDWILTRRFFLFDTVSGLPESSYPNGKPLAVRYPKEIILKVNLDLIEEEMINVPYFYIAYRERAITLIEENPLASINFKSEYLLPTNNFWKMAKIAFYVVLGLMILTIFGVTYL